MLSKGIRIAARTKNMVTVMLPTVLTKLPRLPKPTLDSYYRNPSRKITRPLKRRPTAPKNGDVGCRFFCIPLDISVFNNYLCRQELQKRQ